MGAVLLVLASFALCFYAARRSLSTGLAVLLGVGYFYGILRVNMSGSLGLFIFDAGLLAIYFEHLRISPERRTRALQIWIGILIIWPCIVALVPLQPILVTLVGLRGNVFLLPLCLLGAQLAGSDLKKIASVLACLNIIAVAFGLAEYFLGMEHFYPKDSPLAYIIYASHDVAGYKFHRIPATFSSAHAYGGTMAASLPLIIGAWAQKDCPAGTRIMLVIGVGAALIGVLLCSARSHFVEAAALSLFAVFSGGLGWGKRFVTVAVLAALAYMTMGNARLQRFESLGDTAAVGERIQGSVNRSFVDVLIEYPLGNGMGGGGTNMPSFLQGAVDNPVQIENEYARILLEQGIIGLIFWTAFLLMFVFRSAAFVDNRWKLCRKLTWLCCVYHVAVSTIGMGLLTSIPETALMLIGIGWVMVLPVDETAAEPEQVMANDYGYAV